VLLVVFFDADGPTADWIRPKFTEGLLFAISMASLPAFLLNIRVKSSFVGHLIWKHVPDFAFAGQVPPVSTKQIKNN